MSAFYDLDPEKVIIEVMCPTCEACEHLTIYDIVDKRWPTCVSCNDEMTFNRMYMIIE